MSEQLTPRVAHSAEAGGQPEPPQRDSPTPAAPQRGAEPAPRSSWLGSITRGTIEKTFIGTASLLFGGALLYYLHEFKQNQDSMKLIMAAEHGEKWASGSQLQGVPLSLFIRKFDDLAAEQKRFGEQIASTQKRVTAIVRWAEEMNARSARFGANEQYGEADLNSETDGAVVYINTQHVGGRWFKRGDRIVITNRHNSAQGPEYLAEVTSAYPFQRKRDKTPVLLQISKFVAAKLRLPLDPNEGIFDVSIRKERSTSWMPTVEEFERKQ